MWARILAAVPDSRLLLKAMAFEDETVTERYRRLFASNGIDPARVDLRSWTASHDEHIELYSRIDIGLDTFPYAGTTTSCETLWMGVPIVTFGGETHVSRVGVSS